MDRGRQGEPPDVLSHPVEFVEWLWDEDEQQNEQQDEGEMSSGLGTAIGPLGDIPMGIGMIPDTKG